jgi:hypothetical protein
MTIFLTGAELFMLAAEVLLRRKLGATSFAPRHEQKEGMGRQ